MRLKRWQGSAHQPFAHPALSHAASDLHYREHILIRFQAITQRCFTRQLTRWQQAKMAPPQSFRRVKMGTTTHQAR